MNTPGLALLALVVAAPASAQTYTQLALTDHAAVSVPADGLDVTGALTVGAPSADMAQATLDVALAGLVHSVAQDAGITISAGGVASWQQPGPRPHWQASQEVVLSGPDTPAFQDLLTHLESDGLVIERASGHLSDAARDAATAQVDAAGVTALRAHAERIAKDMGLRFLRFRGVAVGEPTWTPLMATIAPASAAQPDQPTAHVTVSGWAVLGPLAAAR